MEVLKEDIVWAPPGNPEYEAVINQIGKDFTRAGCRITLGPEIKPQELTSCVFQFLFNLLNRDFERFLHLMYIADVPQQAFLNSDIKDPQSLAKIATVLLLKREVKKVKYKIAYAKSTPN